MTGWNEIQKALDRAEREIARLHAENAELRRGHAERRLRRVEVHAPASYLGRINHIWAFLSSDEGGEGVIAGPLGPYPAVPFIAADEARLASLGPLARQLGKAAGKVILLAKFSSREDVERIEP